MEQNYSSNQNLRLRAGIVSWVGIACLFSLNCHGENKANPINEPVQLTSLTQTASSVPALQAPGQVAGIPGNNVNVFVELAKQVVPSVVNISTFSVIKNPPLVGSPDDLFRRFFEDFFGPGMNDPFGPGNPPGRPQGPHRHRPGPRRPESMPKAMALGTGFIIDASGLVLTNNHVVSGADEIKIAFTDDKNEKATDGKVVGRDPDLDVALISVKTTRKLTPIQLGDSDALEVGEYVAAVGNPLGQGHSVTHGIISAKGRLSPDFPLMNYIQTDAPINPGNSGGPLVNLKAQVIGINNAIAQGAQGIGFAIPINLVKSILPQLKEKGIVERSFLGIYITPLTPEIASQLKVSKDLNATVVTQVSPGSPAEKAGIEPYDIILEVNHKKVQSPSELISAVAAIPVGTTVPVKLSRSGKEKVVQVKLAKKPSAEATPSKPSKDEAEPSKLNSGLKLEEITPEIETEFNLPKGTKGVVVVDVNPDSPAGQSQLIPGDIILEVDRKPVKSVKQFYSLISQKKTYLLRIRRNLPGGQGGIAIKTLDLSK